MFFIQHHLFRLCHTNFPRPHQYTSLLHPRQPHPRQRSLSLDHQRSMVGYYEPWPSTPGWAVFGPSSPRICPNLYATTFSTLRMATLTLTKTLNVGRNLSWTEELLMPLRSFLNGPKITNGERVRNGSETPSVQLFQIKGILSTCLALIHDSGGHYLWSYRSVVLVAFPRIPDAFYWQMGCILGSRTMNSIGLVNAHPQLSRNR